jgi:hypothetical protein
MFEREGISLLHSPLPVFGATADIPLEMPIFQALVAALSPSVELVSSIGRATALASFIVSAILIYSLLSRWVGAGAGLLAAAAYLFSPFSIQWGAAFLIESTVTMFSLLLLFAFDSWLRTNNFLWILIGNLGALTAFLIKPTTAIIYIFAFCLSVLAIDRKPLKNRGLLKRTLLFACYGGPILGLASAIFWTRHADEIKSKSEFGKHLMSQSLMEWNFGTISQRIDPTNWMQIFDRIYVEILGPGYMAVIFAYIIFCLANRRKPNQIFLFSGAVAAAGPLIFFNLYVVHSYYLMAILPLVVIFATIALFELVRSFTGVSSKLRFGAAIALLAWNISFSITTPAANADLAALNPNHKVPEISLMLNKVSSMDEQTIIFGCDWDPTVLYYADRKGLMMWPIVYPNGPKDAQNLLADEIEKYEFVVACNSEFETREYLPNGTTLQRIPAEGFQLFRITHENRNT